MPQKKHIKLRSKHIGVFFLFLLNCLLVSASFVHFSSINGSPGHFDCPVQNQSGQEPEKDCSFHFTSEQTDQSFTRGNRRHVQSAATTKALLQVCGIKGKDDLRNFASNSSSLIRPAYYTFLFLYKLF